MKDNNQTLKSYKKLICECLKSLSDKIQRGLDIDLKYSPTFVEQVVHGIYNQRVEDKFLEIISNIEIQKRSIKKLTRLNQMVNRSTLDGLSELINNPAYRELVVYALDYKVSIIIQNRELSSVIGTSHNETIRNLYMDKIKEILLLIG